jgi:signal transduction histidine kinase
VSGVRLKYCVQVLICLIPWCSGQASPYSPRDSVFTIKERNDFFPLNLTSFILRDARENLTIDSVVNQGAKFEPITDEIYNFSSDKVARVYWFRCTIQNLTGISLHELFCLQPGLDTVDYYFFHPDSTRAYTRATSMEPTRTRPFFISQELATPIHLQKGVTKIYLRIVARSSHSHALKSIIASLADEQAFLNYFLEYRFYQGIALGMLLLILIFHIFIYGFLRDPVYLVFSINVFVTLIYLILRKNYLLEFDLPYPLARLLVVSHDVISIFISLTAVWFGQVFLNTKGTDIIMHRIMNALMGALGVACVCMIAGVALGLMNLLSIYLAFSAAILVIISSVRSYFRGNNLALYVFFGFLILVAIPLIYLIPIPNYLHFRSNEADYNYFGEAIRAAIFAVGIADRFYLMKKEVNRNELEKKQLIIDQARQIQDEKGRISRDLHDNIGSQLAVLSLDLRHLNSEMASSSKIDAAQENIQSIIGQLRDTVWALENNQISMDAMENKLNTLLWNNRKSTPNVEFNLEISETLKTLQLKPAQAINSYRIIQEAIQNAIRHSNCSKVTINFKVNGIGKRLFVEVTDNGKGFDTAVINHQSDDHYGIRNLKKRAEAIDGLLEITSTAGQGTTVSLVFPIHADLVG